MICSTLWHLHALAPSPRPQASPNRCYTLRAEPLFLLSVTSDRLCPMPYGPYTRTEAVISPEGKRRTFGDSQSVKGAGSSVEVLHLAYLVPAFNRRRVGPERRSQLRTNDGC